MKGIIYRIYCKDDKINDCYIGSTSQDIEKRIRKHKYNCKEKKYKIYNFINENKGWNNFTYEVLEIIDYEKKLDLLKKEREYIDKFKPTLNKIKPLRTLTEYRDDFREKRNTYSRNYYLKMKKKI